MLQNCKYVHFVCSILELTNAQVKLKGILYLERTACLCVHKNMLIIIIKGFKMNFAHKKCDIKEKNKALKMDFI